MTEMVERVGRALASQEGCAYDPLRYDERARVAIAAMREPTFRMAQAGIDALAASTRATDRQRMMDCFSAQIDAALTLTSEARP